MSRPAQRRRTNLLAGEDFWSRLEMTISGARSALRLDHDARVPPREPTLLNLLGIRTTNKLAELLSVFLFLGQSPAFIDDGDEHLDQNDCGGQACSSRACAR